MCASPSLSPSSPILAGKTPPRGVAPGSYRERLLVAVFVLFTSFTFFLIQYDRMRIQNQGLEDWVRFKLSGSALLTEGDQYRIALPYLVHFLELHAHLRPNQSLPLIEFLSYAFALMLLYFLFRCSPRVEDATASHRLVLLGLFFAAAQFPILWIFPWERPETLPTTFYLAALLLLVVRRSRMPFALVCLLTLLLTLVQSLVRADVPFVVGIAIVLSAAMSIPFPRSRAHIAVLGLLCAAVAGAAQLYLQHVFPLQTAQHKFTTRLGANLDLIHPPLHLPIFLTGLLPLIVSLFLLRRHHLPLDSSDKLVILMCLLYLPAFVAIGLVVEIRIFVPFLFLASPAIAKLWGAFLLHQDNGT
jgi:hypothetical protein